MIANAITYETHLREMFYLTWFNDNYKYFMADSYYYDITVDTSTWDGHQFVSLDEFRNVIGYIAYSINRQTNAVSNLAIINFSNNKKTTFAKDILRVIRDIFIKFKFNKLVFKVVVGNPAEKHYDRLVNRFGGRIVGIFENDIRLPDNELYDMKYYEITRDQYLSNFNKGE